MISLVIHCFTGYFHCTCTFVSIFLVTINLDNKSFQNFTKLDAPSFYVFLLVQLWVYLFLYTILSQHKLSSENDTQHNKLSERISFLRFIKYHSWVCYQHSWKKFSSVTSMRQGGQLPPCLTILVWAHQPLVNMTNKQRLVPPKLLIYLLIWM